MTAGADMPGWDLLRAGSESVAGRNRPAEQAVSPPADPPEKAKPETIPEPSGATDFDPTPAPVPDAIPDERYKISKPAAASPAAAEPDTRAPEPTATSSEAPAALGPVERLRGLASGLKSNPLALLAGALVIVVGVFSVFRRDGTQAEAATPRQYAAAEDFPTIDFKNVERSVVKQTEIGELLRRERDLGNGQTMIASRLAAREAALREESSTPTRIASPPARADQPRRARRPRPPPPEPPPAVEEPAAPPQPKLGQFFAPGGTLDLGPKVEEKQKKRLQLEVATRIPAALDVGISSARHGTVLARTLQEVKTLDGVKVPKGTVLTGRSSNGSERVFVDFAKIVVGGVSYDLTASATTGRKIGLPATRVETSLEDRASDSLASDALQALKGVARVAGGPIGRGAAEISDGAINEAQRDMQVDHSFVLEVPAGTQFEVVITAL